MNIRIEERRDESNLYDAKSNGCIEREERRDESRLCNGLIFPIFWIFPDIIPDSSQFGIIPDNMFVITRMPPEIGIHIFADIMSTSSFVPPDYFPKRIFGIHDIERAGDSTPFFNIRSLGKGLSALFQMDNAVHVVGH